MDRVNLLVTEWMRAKLGVQEYIDAMPEDGIAFKPTSEIRSFAENYLHVAGTNYAFASAASGRDNPYDMMKGKDPEQVEDLKQDKAALLEFVMGSYDFMLDAVKGLSDAALDEDVEFFKMRMRRHVLLAKAMEHHAHHRGQTAIYLRLKSITPPSERLF
ncbi:MAG: DinB family protein [Pyrinomonadaceae bacterium]